MHHIIKSFFMCLVILKFQGIRSIQNTSTTEVLLSIRRSSNSAERPHELAGQEHVNISMYILNIRAASEESMEVVYDMYLRYKWNDPRLKFDMGLINHVIMQRDEASKLIWFPDLFFANSHSTDVHQMLEENSGVKIFSNGDVRVSVRLSLAAHCDMDLHEFPFDEQVCSLTIESYMYSKAVMSLHLDNCGFNRDAHPVAFQVDKLTEGIRMEVLSTGTYEQAYVNFQLKRISGHYFVLIYLPSLTLVILSTLIFWLPLAALSERTLFSVFLLFAMIPILVSSQYNTPQVGYLKAVDVWVVSCFMFLAVAVLEVMMLHLIFGREQLSKAGQGDQFELMRDDENRPAVVSKIGPWVIRPDIARKVDISLRVIYPAAYIVFIAIYWATYADK